MIDRLRLPAIFAVCFAICGWIGFRIYTYATHDAPPVFAIKGFENGGSYGRQSTGSITASNAYKIYSVKATLDGKELFTKWVKSKEFDEPFTIDTTTLAEGPHTLEFEAVDSSYHSNKSAQKMTITVDNSPLRATFVQAEYAVDQGKTVHMKVQANKKLGTSTIKVLNTVYQFFPSAEDSTLYECFVPVDCEERPQELMLTADVQDLVNNSVKLNCKVTIKNFEFKKQRGFVVTEEKLNQEKEASMSSKVLNEALEKWLSQSPKKKMWSGPFEYPIEVQRMTTPFGEIRMTPERGRYMHRGVDLINHPKCVVWAAQHGKVIIKDRFFISGNTIVVDHGLGVFTLYGHLEDYADIEVGDMIKKGAPVGKVGKTGYASGYHLHWELRVNNVAVDPIEWTSKVF